MINTQESMTAKLCSFARAFHSNLKDNEIFDDYLAYKFIGEKEYKRIENIVKKVLSKTNENSSTMELLNKYISPILLPRAAYSEAQLCRFSRKHKNIQYVIMGAGMDTFDFRNKNANIKIFELDYPSTQKYKLKRIKELNHKIPSNMNFTSIDFEKENIKEVLLKSGFDPSVPSFFSILGVTYYITLSSFEKTFKDISNITNNEAEIVFDYPDETIFTDPTSTFLAKVTEKFGEPMKHGFSYKDFEKIFLSNGFKAKQHLTPEKIQNIYFKNNKNEQKAYKNIHFMSAIKEEI